MEIIKNNNDNYSTYTIKIENNTFVVSKQQLERLVIEIQKILLYSKS